MEVCMTAKEINKIKKILLANLHVRLEIVFASTAEGTQWTLVTF